MAAMNELFQGRQMALLGVALLGVALLLAAWAYRAIIDLLPIGRARREALSRATPVIGTVVGLLYALYVARALLAGYEAYVPAALALLVGAFLLASWFAIRDVVNGMFLKAGRICAVGDHVRIGEIQGRVEHMGLRTMTVETSGGDEAILPYSAIARDSVMRTPVSENSTLHVFRMDLPRGLTVVDAKNRIRQAALRSHWSSVTRDPDVTFLGNDLFEVSVFALDTDHGPAIEDAVRQALARAGDPRDFRPPSGPVPGAS
jgi:small-conductance mechanosensitive channel